MGDARRVRRAVGYDPIVRGSIGTEEPLKVERYLFRKIETMVPALDHPALVTILGGRRLTEDAGEREQYSLLPSQSILYPAKRPTHWSYRGLIDFVVFYFPDQPTGVLEQLCQLLEMRDEPLAVDDSLASAAALQVVSELQRGRGADEQFLLRLATLMMEQVYRVLTIPALSGIDPRHADFVRLQPVIRFIHEHLGGDLSVPVLAARTGVSVPHFRRLFQHATGMPPHRFVLSARLTQARKLLAVTPMSITRIAAECGFSNQSHLTSSFRQVHAATPAQYREQLARRRS